MTTKQRYRNKKYDWECHEQVQQSLGILADEKKLSTVDQRNIHDLRTIFTKLVSHLHSEKLIDSQKDIELLILSTGKLRAFVEKGSHGKYAICISIGMLRAVWNVLLLSLCDNKIFPNYGGEYGAYKVQRRINLNVLFGPAVIPAKNSQQHFKSKKELQKYQDITPSRKELCETLYNAIVDYILYHEAMHITRDHFAFDDISKKINAADEAKTLSRHYKLSTLLEMDADLAALNFLLPTNTEMAQFNHLSKFRRGDFVFGEMFSNIVLNQLLDCEERGMTIRNQWKRDHPPPLVRSMLYDNLLRQIFIQKKLLAEDKILDQQSKAWWEASRIAIKLGFPSGRWHGKTIDGISQKALGRVIERFNSFREAIEHSHQTGSYKEIKKIIQDL